MVKTKTPTKCRFGKLSTPVRTASGSMRRCKLKPKSTLGISRDRKTKSNEAHEVRYNKKKRATANTKKRK
jgi:hypothetical protein